MPAVVLRQFTLFVAGVLGWLLNTYLWIVIISVLLTWVNPDPRNPIVRFLYGVTEPVLSQIRHRFPFVIVGNFDLSPLVLMVAIRFLQTVVVQSLVELAVRIGALAGPVLHVG
jgi:YggT family protein